jgi:hypothetical protein
MAPNSSARITSSRDRPDLTTVTVEGTVTADQVRGQIVQFLSGDPTQLVVWDIRRGSLSGMTAENMRMIISAGAPFAHRRRNGRTAIVSTQDVDFGLSRMFQAIAELQHIPFEVEVFRDMELAMAWLRGSTGG